MRTKAIVGIGALLILVAVLIFGAGQVFAQQQPADSTASSIALNGNIAIVQGEEGQIVQMAANTQGTGGWHLEAALTPVSAQRSGREGGVRILLRGNFKLVGNAGSVQGSAQATMNQQGAGTLQLTDSSGGTALSGPFQISSGAGLTLNLQGQLPTFATAPTSTQATQPSNHFFWYVSRTAAFAAYALLVLNVCLGLLMHTGWADRMMARWRTFDLHQFTALLAMAFVGAHVFSLLGDHFYNFSVSQLFVPLASPYRPLWTALGVLSLYLLIAVVGSFYIRRHIGLRTWRTLHYATFVAFLMVLGHGLLSGTDSVATWARLLYFGTGSTVALLTLWRVLYVPPSSETVRERERIPARSNAAPGSKASRSGHRGNQGRPRVRTTT